MWEAAKTFAAKASKEGVSAAVASASKQAKELYEAEKSDGDRISRQFTTELNQQREWHQTVATVTVEVLEVLQGVPPDSLGAPGVAGSARRVNLARKAREVVESACECVVWCEGESLTQGFPPPRGFTRGAFDEDATGGSCHIEVPGTGKVLFLRYQQGHEEEEEGEGTGKDKDSSGNSDKIAEASVLIACFIIIFHV